MDRLEKINGSTLSRHLCHCAACREYDEQMTRFGEQLKQSACGQLSQAGTQSVEASVLKALDMTDIAKHPIHNRIPLQRRRQIPYAVAAGFVMIAGLFGWLYWSHQRNIKAVASANETIAALSNNVSFLTLLTEHPAQQEMTEFVDNAQRAVVFITNCIPQEPSGLDTIPGKMPGN
jgi:hypothetical protein